jgi:two-component system chemotaxis response regulator CheY
MASNRIEALEIIAVAEFDVILADVNMPDMDGILFVRVARTLPAYRYVLILTTEGSDEKVRAARAAGATGWLVEPFEPDRLLDAVRRVVQ